MRTRGLTISPHTVYARPRFRLNRRRHSRCLISTIYLRYLPRYPEVLHVEDVDCQKGWAQRSLWAVSPLRRYRIQHWTPPLTRIRTLGAIGLVAQGMMYGVCRQVGEKYELHQLVY